MSTLVIVMALTGGIALLTGDLAVRNNAPVYEIAVQMIPFGSAPESDPILFLARSDGSMIRRLKARSGLPVWSRDGRFVANAQIGRKRREGVYIMSADGKSSQRLARSGRVLSWSPRGDEVLSLRHGRLDPRCDPDYRCFLPDRYSIVRIRDGRSWSLFERDEVLGGSCWMPDGTLLIAGIEGRFGRTSIYAVAPDHSLRRLTPPGSYLGMPQVSRDGRTVVVLGQRWPDGRFGFWRLDPSTEKLQWIRRSGYGRGFEYRLSPDGRWIAFDCRGVCVMDVENARIHRVSDFTTPGLEGYLTSISWSPDSRSIAAIIRIDENDSDQIVIVAVDGSSYYYVPSDEYSENSFSWSPDSRSIAYVSDESWYGPPSREALWVIPADGSDRAVRVAGTGYADIRDFAWRPVPSSN